jgi:large repetitive protein
LAARRWRGSTPFLVALATLCLLCPGASAESFPNEIPIAIPANSASGHGDPYPSEISVSEMTGPVTDVDVTLRTLSHNYPSDLDTLLVGPEGQSVVLMADTGGNTPITSALDFTFDDAASATLPVSAPITAGGTYRPTNGSAFNGTAPAPAGPYGAALSVFNGTDPNGTWSLYAFDDFSTAGGGSIAGGWRLRVTTLQVDAFEPSSGAAGDVVTVTGTGFSGATAIAFGATPATAFTVDSDTQITATVPAGAGTGPVHVTVPAGSAASAADFVVAHGRSATLTIVGKKGRGSLSVTDGFTACAADVPVRIQHRKKLGWRTVTTGSTRDDGSFALGGLKDPGRYRALAKRTTLTTGDVCLKATSPVVRR